jgi:hypothetical protein
MMIAAAGLGLCLALVWLAVKPQWRLAAIVMATLALPGNMDDLWPQAVLDLHDVPDRESPIVGFGDIVLLVALYASAREGRLHALRIRTSVWPWLLTAWSVFATGLVVAVGHGLFGDSAASSSKGAFVWLRLAIVVTVAFAHALPWEPQEVRAFATGCGVSLASLLANGFYTTARLDDGRFTAATFGRNSFGSVLGLLALLFAGLALSRRSHWRQAVLPSIGGIAAVTALSATGTRIALAVLILGAGVLVALALTTWRLALRAGVLLSGMLVLTYVIRSQLPGRSGELLYGIDLRRGVIGGPVRTRLEFWESAIEMANRSPLTGVGPYQWNIERYTHGVTVQTVADTHNAYLQTGAEYGWVMGVLYSALIVAVVTAILVGAWRTVRTVHHPETWVLRALVAAAVCYPITDLTNSGLFNQRVGVFGWLLLGVALASTRVFDRAPAAEVIAPSGALPQACSEKQSFS